MSVLVPLAITIVVVWYTSRSRRTTAKRIKGVFDKMSLPHGK